jgi:2Fe-2S ferredoxin
MSDTKEIILKVTTQNGEKHELIALDGWRAMEVIRDYGLPIKAECGGACSCATCHVYIDPAWVEKLPALASRPETEEDMLDFAFDVRENSRLSCQVRISAEMDGMKVTVPEQQG